MRSKFRFIFVTSLLKFSFISSQAFASQLMTFEGQSSADSSTPCRISYVLDGQRLRLHKIEGQGEAYTVWSEDDEVNEAELGAHLNLVREDLAIFGDPEVSKGLLYGAKASYTEWDYGLRSSVYVGTNEDFASPKAIEFKAKVSLFGVRGLKSYKLKCESLKQLP